MRQRGWIPSADRAHKPAGIAPPDTMQIAVDSTVVTLALFAIPHGRATTVRQGPSFAHSTGALHAWPGSFTSDVVSLEVTT